MATIVKEEEPSVTKDPEELSPGAIAKRFGLNLHKIDVERLHDISKVHDITPTEVIRRSLATEFKLLTIINEGGHVLAERADGRLLELDLNY